jgi:hypothetical protein
MDVMITLRIADPEGLMPGRNAIALNSTNAGAIPYTLTWSYRTLKPSNEAKFPVKLSTKFNVAQAKKGDTISLRATIENVSGATLGMTTAIVGLPAGLTLPDRNELDALTKGKLSAWELRGRELVLCWRELAPNTKHEVEVQLLCRFPGVFHGPPSRVYLGHDSDQANWIEPLRVNINEVKD